MNILKYQTEFAKDMRLKNFAESTIAAYGKCLNDFLLHFSSQHKEPKAITEKEIREYLSSSKSQAILKHRIGALKRFYKFIVRQPLKFKYIEYPRKQYR